MGFVLICVVGCHTPPVKPFESGKDVRQLTSEENRLWHAAMDFDKQLEEADYLYRDPELGLYVQDVLDKLYPEYRGVLIGHILDSPSLNAFALPNGSIYINTGMLARLDNEAQMATVLAHEVVHFTHKHGLQQRRTVKSSTAFSVGFGVITGIPMLGDLIAASSIYGFSRDLEREADEEGFQRLQRARYDITQAPITFELMLAEVEALNIDEPFFFSTHPKLKERIDIFNQLVEQSPLSDGYRGVEAYHRHVEELRLELLEDYLQIGQFQSVLLILERDETFSAYPPRAWFYLGEAYRLRGGEGDATRAVNAYNNAILKEPLFAPTYRSLGVYFMKTDDPEKAQQYFRRYLELSPDAQDRAYIELYISGLEEKIHK